MADIRKCRAAASLTLYSTEHCHLCEQAMAQLASVLGAGASPTAAETETKTKTDSLQITEIDIAADELLLQRYGIRIPVLRHDASDSELDWPFDSADILAFLRRCDSNV